MPELESNAPPAKIPASDAGTTPFWSVMIPTYNPPKPYLEQALSSVLDQGLNEHEMQIEVVDDCSSSVDVESLVKPLGGERIKFSRTKKNLGLAGCWNTCLSRSQGRWVHLLHQDDYVLPS